MILGSRKPRQRKANPDQNYKKQRNTKTKRVIWSSKSLGGKTISPTQTTPKPKLYKDKNLKYASLTNNMFTENQKVHCRNCFYTFQLF